MTHLSASMKAVEKRFRILGRAQNCRCFCWIFGWVSQLHHAKDVQKFSRLLWCHGNWEIYFCGYLLILSSYSPLGIAPFSSRVLPDGIKLCLYSSSYNSEMTLSGTEFHASLTFYIFLSHHYLCFYYSFMLSQVSG